MKSHAVNPHQRAALIEEGRFLERLEREQQAKLKATSDKLAELIMGSLWMTPLEEWPPVAKAALKHIGLTDSFASFEFKQALAKANAPQPVSID